MTRREWLAALGAAAVPAKAAPTAPVAIARCASYDEDIAGVMRGMFDSLGGLAPLVRNKTVTVKLNLTGSPALRFQGRPLGVTHYTHPATATAMAHLLIDAGARRVRFVESCWATAGPLDEYLLESGWNVRQLKRVAPDLELINTNALAGAKQYKRLKVPAGGMVFPAWDLHPAYEETDVFVSMAKLKNHETCGVTLSMKNIFGIAPASIYGDDAGIDEPNEQPGAGRVSVCHFGKRGPSKSAPQEIDPGSPRDQHFRMPRIVTDLNAARPVHIAFIDGIETMTGGEGPWIRGVGTARPGLLVLGTNAVCTDAVAAALMGYNPRAPRGTAPFTRCDNTLLLAESVGLGTADLDHIELRGGKIADLAFKFPGA
jgi:uncharacterized protein (DUF362 family)